MLGFPVKPARIGLVHVAVQHIGRMAFVQKFVKARISVMRKILQIVVSGGTASENELRTGDYLELVEFSDFQVDPVGGDILGEIRLGYWHHDGKMSIITGGSVSGTMQDLIPSMRFTKETQQFDTAVVPAATKLFGVTITGVK